MGSQDHGGEEGPVHTVTVAAFSMDRFDVTNAAFAKFVAATGYVTDAERKPNPDDFPEVAPADLTPGGAVFTQPTEAAISETDWWALRDKADWRHPEGAGSSIAGRDNDPVVQVSYNDALAYARWAGRDLPTEEQYEYAARGGLDGKTYAWGDEPMPNGKWMANTWQGDFPTENTDDDGFSGIAPAGCFPPNGYGLYDMAGNVWKWTSSVYAPGGDAPLPPARIARTIKGGSFLCSSNFCRRARPAARQPQESGFSSQHIGFRTVRNKP